MFVYVIIICSVVPAASFFGLCTGLFAGLVRLLTWPLRAMGMSDDAAGVVFGIVLTLSVVGLLASAAIYGVHAAAANTAVNANGLTASAAVHDITNAGNVYPDAAQNLVSEAHAHPGVWEADWAHEMVRYSHGAYDVRVNQ
jgi:hypothetical protein